MNFEEVKKISVREKKENKQQDREREKEKEKKKKKKGNEEINSRYVDHAFI